MANRKQYTDFAQRYQYSGREGNLTFVTHDQSPRPTSAESGSSQNCGYEVAISCGPTIKAIITSIDLACKSADATKHKIHEIERALTSYGFESSIRRHGSQLEVAARGTKGPLEFPNIDGIRQSILVDMENIVKQTPWYTSSYDIVKRIKMYISVLRRNCIY